MLILIYLRGCTHQSVSLIEAFMHVVYIYYCLRVSVWRYIYIQMQRNVCAFKNSCTGSQRQLLIRFQFQFFCFFFFFVCVCYEICVSFVQWTSITSCINLRQTGRISLLSVAENIITCFECGVLRKISWTSRRISVKWWDEKKLKGKTNQTISNVNASRWKRCKLICFRCNQNCLFFDK